MGQAASLISILVLLVQGFVQLALGRAARFRRHAGAELSAGSPAERCRDFGDCGPPPLERPVALSDPFNPDSPPLIPMTSASNAESSSPEAHQISTNANIVAPWELDPASKPKNPNYHTSAETFMLEHIKEDSEFEAFNFDRTLSLNKLDWQLRETFCGKGQGRNGNCYLRWIPPDEVYRKFRLDRIRKLLSNLEF